MIRFRRLMLLILALVAMIHCQGGSQSTSTATAPSTTTTPPPTATATAPPEEKQDPIAKVNAPDPAANPCKRTGKLEKLDSRRPVICIQDQNPGNLTVYPDPANAFPAVVLEWWTVSGTGTVTIEWKEAQGPTGMIACTSGTGYCKTMTRADAQLHYPYRYWVAVTKNGHTSTTHDPTIIIDTTATTVLPQKTTTSPTQ